MKVIHVMIKEAKGAALQDGFVCVVGEGRKPGVFVNPRIIPKK